MPSELTIPLFAIHHHKIGGTESAIYNLIHGLDKAKAALTLAFSDPDRLSPEFLRWMAKTPGIAQQRQYPLPGKNSRFAEELLFEWRRSGNGWAVYPNYFLPPRRPGSRAKSAVILHDIQYKVLPQYHSSKRKAWLDFYLPRMFQTADLVFLISNSEKEYVRQHFGDAAADKCKVIYNAIEWARLEQGEISEATRKLAGRPYILTVSHPFPHKNLGVLIKAFDRVAQSNPEIELYLAGKASDEKTRLIRENASEKTAARIVMTGILSDADLGELYRNARLFVLPSLYEGFGMPAAEAMGFGVPTLVSGVTSLPEATLGKAEYVADPTNVDAWAEQMTACLNSSERLSTETVAEVRDAFAPHRVAQSLLQNLG